MIVQGQSFATLQKEQLASDGQEQDPSITWINGNYEITDDIMPFRVIQSCFTICAKCKISPHLKNLEFGTKWCNYFSRMNNEYALIYKLGMTQVISHTVNNYAESVESYFIHGLRDRCKMVALKVLKKIHCKTSNEVFFLIIIWRYLLSEN